MTKLSDQFLPCILATQNYMIIFYLENAFLWKGVILWQIILFLIRSDLKKARYIPTLAALNGIIFRMYTQLPDPNSLY